MIDKQKLTDDMGYLRQYYQWDETDAAEIRRAAKENPEWWPYWANLADAHRAGYVQNAENGFIRLQAWRAANGFATMGNHQ